MHLAGWHCPALFSSAFCPALSSLPCPPLRNPLCSTAGHSFCHLWLLGTLHLYDSHPLPVSDDLGPSYLEHWFCSTQASHTVTPHFCRSWREGGVGQITCSHPPLPTSPRTPPTHSLHRRPPLALGRCRPSLRCSGLVFLLGSFSVGPRTAQQTPGPPSSPKAGLTSFPS